MGMLKTLSLLLYLHSLFPMIDKQAKLMSSLHSAAYATWLSIYLLPYLKNNYNDPIWHVVYLFIFYYLC